MAARHLLSLPSRSAASGCVERQRTSNACRHHPLHCSSNSSRFLTLNHPRQTPLISTVLRARKSKVDTAPSSTVEKLHPETPISSSPPQSRRRAQFSKGKSKDEGLLYEDTADFEFELGYSMVRVCDRLMEVFFVEKTKEGEWRKLLLLSDDWKKIRPHFFKRCKYKASLETDRKKKVNILTLSQKLQKVDEEMETNKQLLEYVEENWPELDVVVAGRRKEFDDGFFRHMSLVCEASTPRLEKRDDIARMAAKCLAVVEAHDRALEDDVIVTVAQKKYENILDAASLDEAVDMIDDLAEKKQLDSTLMLLLAKAWATAKESTTMTEEIKELMHHLYMVARGHMQRLIPKEIRILQQILSIEEPTQRVGALTRAFSPGDPSFEKEGDTLHTKPERLLKWMKIVLDGYHLNKQTTVMDSARQLMNPKIIDRLRQLQAIVEDQFM